MPVAKLLTIEQVAEVFAVHPNTVRNWIREGRLEPVRMGPAILRFRPEDVDRIISNGGAE